LIIKAKKMKKEGVVSVKDRLNEFLRYKNLGQGSFEKICGLSNGYVNNIRKSIKTETFDEKISPKFPELNKFWLLHNEGPMLKGGAITNSEVNNSNINSNGSSVKVHANSDHVKELTDMLKTAQYQLTESQRQINKLLEQQDKPINCNCCTQSPEYPCR